MKKVRTRRPKTRKAWPFLPCFPVQHGRVEGLKLPGGQTSISWYKEMWATIGHINTLEEGYWSIFYLLHAIYWYFVCPTEAIIIIIVVKGLFSASTRTELTLFAMNFLYPRANRKALHLNLLYAFCYSPLWLVGIQQSLHTVGGFATDIT